MRLLQKAGFIILASSLLMGQTSAPTSSSDDSKQVAAQLKALQEALAAQQQQIAAQQQQIESLKKELGEKTSGTPKVVDAALKAPATPPAAALQGEKPKESPLSFRIGGADFTPGGFVDFETVFRTTNATPIAGNPIATSFGAIPFSNSVPGHLTEFRMTGQYSRYNLKITGKYGANNVTGYIEGDFNGADPANVFVTANSHTNRLRLYWLDLKRGKCEFLS